MRVVEVTNTGSTDEANRLLAEGWIQFTVVSGEESTSTTF
jgi:hypothetical protein